MTLAELITSVDWTEVKSAVLWNYPDVEKSIEAYRKVFIALRRMDAVASNMRLVVRRTFREGLDEEPFVEVVGRDGTLNRDLEDFECLGKSLDSEYANSEADFAVTLEPWEHWLGMELDPATLESYTKPVVAAHCIWEMTFHGFEQSQIQEAREELRRRVDELNAMTEEERKEKLIPMEQLRRDVEEWTEGSG